METKLKFDVKYIVVNMSPRGESEIKRFEFDDVHDAVNKHIDEDRGMMGCKGGYWDLIVEYKM